MKPEMYENNEEGILCVYKNPKWLVCIKNWKPDNDINGIKHLEIHHSTDEQFILVHGKAILITAEKKENGFSIDLTLMEQGKVYNVLFNHPERYKNSICTRFQLLYGKQRFL